MEYKHLDWDSSFFKIKTARINPCYFEENNLEELLNKLKKENYKLIYLSCDSITNISKEILLKFNGKLVDKKTTFVFNLKAISSKDIKSSVLIKQYDKSIPNKNLEELAIQSGEYSRFKLDTNFSKEQFETLYKLWILNSVNKTIAEKVIIYEDSNIALGLITLGEKQGRGNIGLISVNRTAQGKGIGKLLINAAIDYSLKKNVANLEVVTQGDNKSACKFYENCGFTVEKIEYLYHFWL